MALELGSPAASDRIESPSPGPQEVSRVRFSRRPSGRDPPHPGVFLLSWPAARPSATGAGRYLRHRLQEMSSGVLHHRGQSRTASDRADEGIITPRRTPEPVSIGRRVEPAAGGSRQAPERPTGNRLMGMLRQLRSTAIALLAIASAAVAMHALLAVLDSVHAALRRRRPWAR